MKMEMVTATQLVGWGMGISEPFRQDSWKMYRIIWRNMYRTVQKHLGEAPEHHIETGFMDGYGQ